MEELWKREWPTGSSFGIHSFCFRLLEVEDTSYVVGFTPLHPCFRGGQDQAAPLIQSNTVLRLLPLCCRASQARVSGEVG